MTDARNSRDIPPVPDALKHYTSKSHIATDYDNYYRNTQLLRYDTKVLDAAFDQPGKLLDLGCGPGRHLAHFAGRGFQVIGVDLSPHMVTLARKNLRAKHLRGVVIEQDICNLGGFDEGSFDYCIAMFSVLGMVQGSANRLSILKQVRRLLAPEGLFAFHTHNRLFHAWNPEWLIWLLRTYLVDPLVGRETGDRIVPLYRGIANMYIHVFTDTEIERMLDDAGFELIHVEYLNARHTGPLASHFARGWRANGFVYVVRKTNG